jgi:uncharacterized UPF0160 family protein
MKQIKTVVTHNSRFHSDDVFAVAALRELFGEEFKLIRTRDRAIISTADIAVDTGDEYDPARMRFDHHQAGRAGARPNGVEYASFGLVWKHFGVQLTGSQDVAEYVDKKLVQAIDAMDNGNNLYETIYKDVHPYIFQSMVFSYDSTWKEEGRDLDAAFLEVVDIARKALRREIIQAQHLFEAKTIVEEAYHAARDKRIIELDRKYPYVEILNKFPEPLYIVRPNVADGTWKVECMQDSLYTYTNRKLMPQSWAGKRYEELDAATGVPGCVFCHTTPFVAVTKTREAALQLAQLAADA